MATPSLLHTFLPQVSLLLLALASSFVVVGGSEFDPDPITTQLQPFVDGWFMRVTDQRQNVSFATIFASFKPRDQDSFNNSFSTLLLSTPDVPMRIDQTILPQSKVTYTRRSSNVPGKISSFRISSQIMDKSEDMSYFDVNDSTASLSYVFPATIGVRIEVNMTNRVPWNSELPNSDGPEGLVIPFLPFHLPLRYYVHSLASEARYRIQDIKSSLILHEGNGYAHMEKNWGREFPSAWMWSQALGGSNGSIQFLATSVKVSPLAPLLSLVGVRAPGIHWDFRLLEFKNMTHYLGKQTGTWNFVAQRGQRELRVNLTAPTDSFSERLLVPTPSGFTNATGVGAMESYIAQLSFVANEDDVEVLRASIPRAALEFGGQFGRP